MRFSLSSLFNWVLGVARKKVGMLRVHRDTNGLWWLDTRSVSSVTHHEDFTKLKIKPEYDAIVDMPEDIGDKLSLLLHADVGSTIAKVGKRISDTNFWIYLDGDISWRHEENGD